MESMRDVTGVASSRLRGAAARGRASAFSQWRRNRAAARRIRTAARAGLRDARNGVRRWAKAIRRKKVGEPTERLTEQLPVGEEHADSLGIDLSPKQPRSPVSRKT